VALNYRVIEIFTSEDARCGGTALYRAVVHKVSSFRIAARCVVTRGIAGSYESGEVATQAIEVLSYNMPLKIEIILPAAELSRVLPEIEAMVTDGMVVVEEMDIRCHRTKKRLIPRQVRVRDTMTGSPQSVSPETPATEVVHILRSARFHGLPVVDAAGKPVGIITQGDLIRRGGLPLRVGLLAELDSEHFGAAVSPLAQKTAADIMSAPVVTVAADATLTAAVDLMLARQLKRLPVVDGEGRLCGMLARLDVFQVISRDTPSWQRMREQHVAVGDVRYVRDIMGRDTHEVAPDAPIEEVVRLIDDSEIQRVAVVDPNRKFLGIVSDRALLAAFSEHRAGFWGFLLGRYTWAELGTRHRALVEFARAKRAADAMQTDLVTVREDTSVDEAIQLMTQHGIKRLPVVDEAGVFRGMVSRDALLRVGVGHGQKET